MIECTIFKDSYEVEDKLLTFFGVTKKDLQRVAMVAGLARNDATALHPVNAAGIFSYMHGTAALRELFLSKNGWKLTSNNNIEAIENELLNITIIFQNVDIACSIAKPKAISKKGPGSAKLLDNQSYYLFEYMAEEQMKKANQNVWYFCVSSDGEQVRAELSRPSFIENGCFEAFAERIYVLTENDGSPSPIDDFEKQDFEVLITKKDNV